MRFDILTLFPDFFPEIINSSMLKKAQEVGAVQIFLHDIRGSATDNHKTVDDTPYGGGAGMLLKVDVLYSALEKVLKAEEIQQIPGKKRQIVLLTPQGERYIQKTAQYFSENYEQITLICGHYEGFDERIRSLVDTELSIGDFVLTGGELAALIVVDSISRLLPGVLAENGSSEESHSITDQDGNTLLEYPHYTRPYEFQGQKVPDILLSGNHAQIASWRLEEAKKRTKRMKENNES